MLLKNASRKTSLQLLYIIVLSILAFFKLIAEEKDINIIHCPLLTLVPYFYQLVDNHFFIFKIATFLLYIFNAILLTYILRKHKLIELHKYYPSFFFLLFGLFILQTSLFIPFLINSIILIFLIPPLFSISDKNYNQKNGLVFGFFCGSIMLLYAPFVFFFLLIYFVFILNGVSTWRTYVIPFLGLLLSYIYFFSALYLADYENYSFLLSFYSNQFTIAPFSIDFTNYFQIIIYSCFLLFYLIFFYLLLVKSNTMSIFIRKKYYFILLYSVFSIIFSYIFSNCCFLGSTIFITILSTMVGIYESFIKKRLIYNILILIFLLALLADYFHFLYA